MPRTDGLIFPAFTLALMRLYRAPDLPSVPVSIFALTARFTRGFLSADCTETDAPDCTVSDALFAGATAGTDGAFAGAGTAGAAWLIGAVRAPAPG